MLKIHNDYTNRQFFHIMDSYLQWKCLITVRMHRKLHSLCKQKNKMYTTSRRNYLVSQSLKHENRPENTHANISFSLMILFMIVCRHVLLSTDWLVGWNLTVLSTQFR